MIGARRILIRDWRTNWLFWTATGLAHLLYAAAIVRRSLEMPDFVDSTGLLLGFADIAILAIATAAIIQADSPSNRLSDWHSRPVPRGQILLAKVASILAALIVPRFLIGVAGGPLFGLTITEATVSAGLHLITDLAVCSVLLACSAATRNIGQLVLAGGLFSLSAAATAALLLHFGLRITLAEIAFGVSGLACVCGGLTACLYLSERSAISRFAIVAVCLTWLPLASAVSGIASMTATSQTVETDVARQIQVESVVYDSEGYASEDGPWLDRPDYSLLPFRLSAPPGVALEIKGGSFAFGRASTLEWKPGFRLPNLAFNDDRPRMLKIPNDLKSETGLVRVTLEYRAFSLAGREMLISTHAGYHRINQLGSCRFRSNSFTSFECVGAVYPPCFGRERRLGDSDRHVFHNIAYCPPDRFLRLARWPLPYAFTEPLNIYDNDMIALLIWRDQGRVERGFTIDGAEFQRRLVSRATVYGSDTAIQEP